MTATRAHDRICAALTNAEIPHTVGQTPKAGPVVVVGLPALTSLDGWCDPPVGEWATEIALIPAGTGTREDTLARLDQLVAVLAPLGALIGSPTPVTYGDLDLDAYTLTLTVED